MSSNKIILGLEKQNNGIYSSLINNGIQFNRIVIPDDIDELSHITLLKEENTKLKEKNIELKKVNMKLMEKPVEFNKQTQPPPIITKTNKHLNEDEEDEEVYIEPIKKFDTITNMEDMKRAFFNGNYELFETQIKAFPFRYYKVMYKYDSEKDGVADFAAKNLLNGFVRNFDDYKKYFMICFRCLKHNEELKYKYESFWIVNTNEPLTNIIGSIEDDFIFEEQYDIDNFILNIKKTPELNDIDSISSSEYTCIKESYVH